MQCLVTGATGFVGRALVRRLRAGGHVVRGVARSGGAGSDESITQDLATLPQDSGLCDGIDLVFHLAAKTHDMHERADAEAEYTRINVEGTRRLVDAASRAGVRRFVFVSSVKVVDEGNLTPATEETPLRPLTAYGRSKLEAERLVAAAAARGAFEHVCLRFPLVYGPGQRGNLERMTAAIARNRFPPPPHNRNRRSMLHVENAVDALVLAGMQPVAAGRTYLVTDARDYSTREIYDAVRAALGRRPSRVAVPEGVFRFLAMAGDLARRLVGRRLGFDSDAFQKLLGSAAYDSSRIRRELGYAPSKDLLSTLPSIVDEGAGR